MFVNNSLPIVASTPQPYPQQEKLSLLPESLEADYAGSYRESRNTKNSGERAVARTQGRFQGLKKSKGRRLFPWVKGSGWTPGSKPHVREAVGEGIQKDGWSTSLKVNVGQMQQSNLPLPEKKIWYRDYDQWPESLPKRAMYMRVISMGWPQTGSRSQVNLMKQQLLGQKSVMTQGTE